MSADDQSIDLRAHQRGLKLLEFATRKAPGWVDACLEAALEDPHPYVRSHGASALVDAADREVVPRLAAALDSTMPQVVRWRAERLLIRRDAAAALTVIGAELGSDEPDRCRRAAEALGRLGPGALPLLREARQHDDPGVRRRAAKALGQIDAPGAAQALELMLDDPDANTRMAALKAVLRLAQRPGMFPEAERLGEAVASKLSMGSNDRERALALHLAARLDLRLDLSDDDRDHLMRFAQGDPSLEQAMMTVLARAGANGALSSWLESASPVQVLAAACALARFGAPSELAQLVGNPDPSIRLVALRGLAACPDHPMARQMLEGAASDDDPAIRWLVERGLRGALDRRRATLHQGRLPAEGPSAQWPYGLPPPAEGHQRRGRLPLALATTNLSYNMNLGVLIRSAEAAGARDVFVAGRDYSHRVAAMGADLWVDLLFFDDVESLLLHARGRGYQIVAVQQSPGAERFDRADYPPRPCLLLGSEGPGLDPELCARADLVVEIPLRGEIDSLNVGCAATLALWAVLIQRGWI